MLLEVYAFLRRKLLGVGLTRREPSELLQIAGSGERTTGRAA
jgi:hypothetical protein